MSDIELLPVMRYVPTQKVRAPFFLFPPKPIAIRDPELGYLAGTYKKGIPQERRIPQEPFLGDLRNEDDDSPRKWNGVPGEWGIPQNGGSEKGEQKKGMHSLDIVGCSKIVSFLISAQVFGGSKRVKTLEPDYLRTKIPYISALSNGYN